MTRRLLALIMTIVLVAAACGGGDDSSDDAAGDDTSQSSDDSGGSDDDGGSDDSGGSDDDASASAAAGEDSSGDDGSDDAAADGDDGASGSAGSLDCLAIEEAIDQAANSIELEPTADPDDLEASFNESRSQLQALGEAAPELGDDVDAALAGLDAIGSALAAIDWNAQSMATNPEAALQFASLLNDPAVAGMTQAMANISGWLAAACG